MTWVPFNLRTRLRLMTEDRDQWKQEYNSIEQSYQKLNAENYHLKVKINGYVDPCDQEIHRVQWGHTHCARCKALIDPGYELEGNEGDKMTTNVIVMGTMGDLAGVLSDIDFDDDVTDRERMIEYRVLTRVAVTAHDSMREQVLDWFVARNEAERRNDEN